MKINSRKLLVFSYALSGKPILYTHLEYLWPEITAGGRRGLVAYLQKQRLITIDYVSKQAQISISAIGRAWVEEEYFSEKKEHSHQGSIVLLYPGMEETIDAQLVAANDLKVGTLLRVDKGGSTKDIYRVLRASVSRIGRNNYALTRKIENGPTS
jgi:hypothetical protein